MMLHPEHLSKKGDTIMKITITVEITPELVDHAHDDLLRRMFYARNKDTLGGYEAWVELCRMYGGLEYAAMLEYLQSLHGYGQATRNTLIRALETIIKGEQLL